jgi:hypothetical protein
MKKFVILLIVVLTCTATQAQIVPIKIYKFSFSEKINGVDTWTKEQPADFTAIINVDGSKINFNNKGKTTLYLNGLREQDRLQDKDGNWTTRYLYYALDEEGESVKVVIRYWDTKDFVQIYIYYSFGIILYDADKL